MARRREERVNLVVPVRIWGLDSGGKAFTQEARTVDITRTGARLSGVFCSPVAGDIIGVQHGRDKARFRIAWVGEKGARDEGQIGIHCVEPTKFIWGVPIPRSAPERSTPVRVQQQMAEGGAGRRTHSRFACDGGAEIRTPTSRNAFWAAVSDISLTGCYLETISPLAAHTRVELLLRIENTEVRSQGIVRTSHPAVGMGIAFTEMSVEDRARIDRMVAELEAKATGKFPVYQEGPGVTQVAELSTRLQNAGTELKQLEHLLVSGNPEIDGRVLRDFRTAVDHARQIVWVVQQWLQLSVQRRDPFEILSQLEEEQVRFTTQLSKDVGMEVDAGALNLTTHGIVDLHHSVAQLHHKLLDLVEGEKRRREEQVPPGRVALTHQK